VAKGVFREDLFYRLNVFPVDIPSLRERTLDILSLARHFLLEHGQRFARSGVTFSPEAEAAMQAYDWPGNVRELENVVQRALILVSGNQISARDLKLPITFVAKPGEAQAILDEAVFAESTHETPKKVDNMRDLEREHILRTLAEVGGSRRLAVERLGISERTLRYKLQQYREEGYLQD